MEIPRSIEEIKSYIDNRVQESLHLDYKISKAIDDSKRNEIAKDVSAFSNSDGGIIVYGVKEDQHLPVEVDGGVDHKKYTREWLEQVIVSNISPIVHGIEIVQIPVSDTHSLYVISVPKSSRGPHQERGTKKYFKRYNFKSSPMEDYEISDIRNRAYIVPPLINVDIVIEHGVMVYLEISNIGNVPALEVETILPDDLKWRDDRAFPPFFTRPIKYFPPGKKFSFMYNTFQTIVNDDSVSDEFNVDVKYRNSRTNEIFFDTFYFNFHDHMFSRYEESEIYKLGNVIKESMKELSKKTDDLGKYVKELTRITDPSGLSLSVTTLKNLDSLNNGDRKLEKLDPKYCDFGVFKEVLGVSDEVARSLGHFFRRNWEGKTLEEIDGVDDTLVEMIKDRFIVEHT